MSPANKINSSVNQIMNSNSGLNNSMEYGVGYGLGDDGSRQESVERGSPKKIYGNQRLGKNNTQMLLTLSQDIHS